MLTLTTGRAAGSGARPGAKPWARPWARPGARLGRLALAPLLACVWCLPAAATALAPPERKSFHQAVEAAWGRYPQRRALAARQNTAAARYAAGGAFFPNAPSLTGEHVNDRIAGSNYNYVTTRMELDTPVWLPRQGTATQGVARAEADAVAADEAAAHLALATEVLDLSAQAAFAANVREVASRRLASLRTLAADAARRFRVGESSRSDALAAEAEAAGASVALSAAEAQLGTALAVLASVTGEASVPSLTTVRAAGARGTGARGTGARAVGAVPARKALSQGAVNSHPRVVAAQRAVLTAQAQARLVRIENRDSPQIGLEGVNEKQAGARWDTRFGVVVHFPFATEARNAPRRAAAEQEVTQAEVQLELARREVAAAIAQAAVALAAAERSVAAADVAAAALETRRGQIERAWRLGEMPLIEVLRANALAFDASLARDKARTGLDAARQRRALAEGLLP